MAVLDSATKSDCSMFLRRRSTHIYHSIILETETDEPTSSDTGSFQSIDLENDDATSALSPGPGPFKIFVLTNSVTNYFCCGYNLTRGIDRLKQLSPLTTVVDKLGGEEIAGIKKKFVSSLNDWILDFGTTMFHLLRFAWIDASLTYLVVLVCGLVSTIGFLRYPDIHSVMKKKAKEVGLLWSILLYIPTFFSVVSIKLWLSTASEHHFLTTKAHPGIKNANKARVAEMEELMAKLKKLTVEALWLETVLEAKPQAVLQTMFLSEITLTANSTVFDFTPVLLSLWSMYTVTNSIYEMVTLNFVDQTGAFAKLYGNSYTALSTLAPALLISTTRKLATTPLGGEEFFLTIVSLGVYYFLFEIIYEIAYMISILVSADETKKHATFVKVYTPVLVLVFSGCVSVWAYRNAQDQVTDNMVKIYIVSGIFVAFLLINLLSSYKAFDFVEECFRLKNVKIDEGWVKLKSKFGRESTNSRL